MEKYDVLGFTEGANATFLNLFQKAKTLEFKKQK